MCYIDGQKDAKIQYIQGTNYEILTALSTDCMCPSFCLFRISETEENGRQSLQVCGQGGSRH
jgi:hypothetical protein